MNRPNHSLLEIDRELDILERLGDSDQMTQWLVAAGNRHAAAVTGCLPTHADCLAFAVGERQCERMLLMDRSGDGADLGVTAIQAE